MMGTQLRLDEVAQRLGVTTDAGIVERLDPVARRLDAVVNLLMDVRNDLAGSVPHADATLAVATGHLADAVVYVANTARAAEEHRRGEW
ncbi:hypothetical protein [Segeticoccus rhizosphaerae]|uniref:hypothetical protein n=1 Tax=Segeticoccus rhizosphaerae TaxID=1104777 RepID=UPI0013968836|nr:hypothetical protein [Segeticoccus rhizosphaerae]